MPSRAALAVVLGRFGFVLCDPSSDVVERAHVEGRVRIVLIGGLAKPEEGLFKLLLKNGDLGELDLRLDAAVIGRPAEPPLSRSGIGFSPNTVHLGMRKAYAVGRVFRDRLRWLVLVPAFRLASV